jgi:large subunit ribosomal protein L10
MNVNKERKDSLIKNINANFKNHDSFYLLDFINMPVSQTMELRKQLHENSFQIKVVKNRLALRALTEDLPDDLKEHFKGPTAIAFASENPLQLARMLRDFSKEHKVLKFKAGLLEGQFLREDQFEDVANLTSREDLLAKVGFLMANPLMRLLRTWQAPIESLGRLLSQLKSKK